MEEEVRKKKVDFSNASFRRFLKDNLKNECVNCGSTIGIEYHHIVPLALGGTNRLTNIVPICHACHQAAHKGRHINHYKPNAYYPGRPMTASIEDSFNALEMYAGGEIGRKECEEMINLSKSTKVYDCAAYRKFKEEYGIIRMKNTYDVNAKKNHGKVRNNAYILEIEFGDPDPGMYYVVGGQPITEIVRKRRRS